MIKILISNFINKNFIQLRFFLKDASHNKATYTKWLAVAITLYAYMSFQQRWIGDDGLIYIRIVKQILAGNGPVFNIGERIEAGTSPLWIWIISGFSWLGFKPASFSIFLGIILSVASLILASVGATNMHLLSKSSFKQKDEAKKDEAKKDEAKKDEEIPWKFPVGIWIYAFIPVAWDYASSGLENGLSMFYIAATYWASARFATNIQNENPAFNSRLLLGFIAGLGPLVRPELALYGGSVLLYLGISMLLTRSIAWKKLFLLIFVSGIAPVGYQLFRMGYYAELVPNTGIAKGSFGPRWEQGFFFFKNFFGFYFLGFVLSIAILLLVVAIKNKTQSSARWLTALPVLSGLFLIIYVVRIGGGFMHGRMFLMPLFLLLIPIATTYLPKIANDRGIGIIAILTIWGVLCGSFIRMGPENYHMIGNERLWYATVSGITNPMNTEDYANFRFYTDVEHLSSRVLNNCSNREVTENAPFVALDWIGYGNVHPIRRCLPLDTTTVAPNTQMVAQRSAIGIAGNFLLDHPIHLTDHHGLSDPISARLIPNHIGRPGHVRFLDNFWLAAMHSLPTENEDPWVTSGRNALNCPELAALLESVRAPLTTKRFFTNFRQSFRNHQIEIPANPFEAEELFCNH